MKKKFLGRLLTMLLVAAMVFTLLPASAIAADWWGSADEYADDVSTQAATEITQPFISGTQGSKYFRIPAIVTLNDGTIVAAADTRWNNTSDSGGIDTMVAYSKDNGRTWGYSWGAYLGKNADTQTIDSTYGTFIDPSLATDGSTVYLLVDLFPRGHSNFNTGLSGNAFTGGFLRLAERTNALQRNDKDEAAYTHYLGKFGEGDEKEQRALIYNADGNSISGYTVDRWFNLYTVDDNGVETAAGNLFSEDAAYWAYPANYLYLTESNDGGATWAAPKLLDFKENGEIFYGTCPGGGYVTSEGTIVFPCYGCETIGQNLRASYIYLEKGKTEWKRSWGRSATKFANTSSEASVTEVKVGNTNYWYAFTRYYPTNTNGAYYVSSDNGVTWTAKNDVQYSCNGALGTLTYSKEIDGQPAILVSSPQSESKAGKIYVLLVNSDGSLTKKYTYNVAGNDYYKYSDITELSDNSIGLLYESDDATITFAKLDITEIAPGATIGTAQKSAVIAASNENGSSILGNVTLRLPAEGESAASVILKADTECTWTADGTGEVMIESNDADELALFSNDVTAVSVKVTPVKAGDVTITAEPTDGTTASASISLNVADASGYTVREVRLKVGEDYPTVGDTSSSIELSGNCSYADNTSVENATGKTIATVKAVYTPGSSDPVKAESIVSGSEYFISDGTHFLIPSNNSVGDATSSNAIKWTINGNSNGYTISTVFNETTYYLYAYRNNRNYSLTISTDYQTTWKYEESYGFYYIPGYNSYYYLGYNSGWKISTSGTYSYPYVPSATEGTTAISFTGVYPGSGSVPIGNTTFNVTVDMGEKSVSVQPNNSVSYNDASAKIVDSGDSKIATATLENGELTIAGVAEGETTIKTGTTIYTVNVAKQPPYVDMTTTPFVGGENEAESSLNGDNETYAKSKGQRVTKLTISEGLSFDLDLNREGETVIWKSADETIAKVDDNGNIEAKKEGETVITVTIDGESFAIPVVVRAGATTTNKAVFEFYIAEITNSTVYYSFDASSDLVEARLGEVIYVNYNSNVYNCLDFFAKPNDKYALTYMSTDWSSGDYYPLHTGDNKTMDISTDGFYNGNAAKSQKTHFGYTDGVDNVQLMTQKAIDKGCDGGMGFTHGSGSSEKANRMLYFRSEKLPTVDKKIESVNGKPYTEGMVANTGDTILFKITVTKYASRDEITYSNVTLSDNLKIDSIEVSGVTLTDKNGQSILNGGIIQIDGTASDEDVGVVYYATYKVTQNDMEKQLVNTAELNYTYSSKYSKGTFQASASAEAQLSLTDFKAPEDIIVDFGLPVTITTDKWAAKYTGSDTIRVETSSAKYGDVIASGDNTTGLTITYTPNQVLPEEDTVILTSNRGLTYSFKVYPASNVLYEENFLTQGDSVGTGINWTLQSADHSTVQETQKANDETRTYNVFGYDDAYKTATGELGAWKAAGLTYSTRTEALTTSFYGNGFDLIGSCGPNTGRVMLAIFKAGDAKPVSVTVVDTRFTDSKVAGTLYQVPWAHVELKEEAQYNVEIYASGCKENSTSTNSVSTYSTYRYAASDDGFDSILASLGVSKAEVEYINVADNANVSSGAASKSVNSIATYAGNEVNANTYEIEVDGFRVYRSSNNNSYPANEQNMTYRNILDVVKGKITAYTEADDNKTVKVEDYEANGGPQNEIYLGKGQAVTFNVGTSVMSIQVSLRAVSGEATWATSTTEGNVVTIKSNTEMYYTVTPAPNGDITIANRGDALLAIGNVKLPAGTVTTSASEMDETAVYESVCAAFATSLPVDPEPEQPTVFVPEHFSIRDYATRFFRSKLVTLRIDFSKDVSYVKIDGRKYTPNKLASWFGYYTVTFTDTIGRNDDYSYEVVFYDANNTPSETQIVYGK